MKLYKIIFADRKYREFDSMVVAAASEEEAIALLKRAPPLPIWEPHSRRDWYGAESIKWAASYRVVEFSADTFTEPTLISAGYNAG